MAKLLDNMENVITKYPKRGDAVVENLTTMQIEYITAESFNPNTLGADRVPIAVVFAVEGKKVYIVYKENANKTYANWFRWKLTGYVLDGTDRQGTLSIRERSSASANTDYVISYNATTMEDLVSQLNAYFATQTILTSQGWIANVDGEEIHLWCKYSYWQQSSYNTGKSGFTLTVNLLAEIKANTLFRRKNGNENGEWAIPNWDRAMVYFRQDLADNNINPTSPISTTNLKQPICLPAYLGTSSLRTGDMCAYLREIYGEGEEGWMKFMHSFEPVYPSGQGHISKGSGKVDSYLLANTTNPNGVHISPAGEYVASISTNLLPSGKWWMPSIQEGKLLVEGIAYGTNPSREADVLNATLYKMGGKAISNGSTLWFTSRYNASSAWLSDGSRAVFITYNMYNLTLVAPISLLFI